jgi:hypothetical protein
MPRKLLNWKSAYEVHYGVSVALIINLQNLKFFAGSLGDSDIQALNAWLTKA